VNTYLSTTFSPSMLAHNVKACVEEMDFGNFRLQVQKLTRSGELVPAVGHENTAQLLRQKLGVDIELYARVNLKLEDGDVLFCAIPQFRAPEAREFTAEEIASAEFRYFIIQVGGEI